MAKNSDTFQVGLGQDERIDDLQLNGLKIIQNVSGYTFTSDSVLLANFVKAKRSNNLLEIGTGTGIISILVNEKQKPNSIIALEIQEKYANLCKKNIALNNINNIDVVCSSVQDYCKQNPNKKFDVVFCNPPYFKNKLSTKSTNGERAMSRFDKFLPIEELANCARKLLNFGGKLYLIYSAERSQEVFKSLADNGFAIKKCCFIHPNENKKANTFLCEATLGGKFDMTILPPVFTNNFDGKYIQTIQKLFGTFKGENL